jgi:hypothetical protein
LSIETSIESESCPSETSIENFPDGFINVTNNIFQFLHGFLAIGIENRCTNLMVDNTNKRRRWQHRLCNSGNFNFILKILSFSHFKVY